MAISDHRNWLQQLALLFLPVLLSLAVPAGYASGPPPQEGEKYEQRVRTDIVLGLRHENERGGSTMLLMPFLAETGVHFRAARPSVSFHFSPLPVLLREREAWGAQHIRGPPAHLEFPMALN